MRGDHQRRKAANKATKNRLCDSEPSCRCNSRARKRALMDQTFRDIACGLVAISRSFYARGWVLGTSGNFSAVLTREPLRLAITASGADKGDLNAEQIVVVGKEGNQSDDSTGKPSAETLLHINVVLQRGAGSVLHTHSVWSPVLS